MDLNHFNEFVGNPFVFSLLKRGLHAGSLPQYLLLSGVEGTGKSRSAEVIAMSLTCEAPIDGEYCGECVMCKKNKLALGPGGTGISTRIEKVNMGGVEKNNTMREQLRSTFDVLRTDGIYVKIFEEFHLLSESNQGLMLEETARIPPNVYVIMTTTHIEYILREMESRCLPFSFGKLNRGECRILVDRVNKNLRLKNEDYVMIYQKTGGVPRNVVTLIEFLSSTNPTAEEIDMLLGNISKQVFLSLFASIQDFRLYMEDSLALQATHTSDLLLSRLTDFFVQILFAIEGEIFETITKADLKHFPFHNSDLVYKALKLCENTKPDEQDIRFLFMKLRRLVATPMTPHEQKTTADVSRQVNVSSSPTAQTTPALTRFRKEATP